MKKKSLFFSPIITFIIVILLAIVFIKPKIDEIFTIKNNIITDSAKLIRITEKVSFLENQNVDKLKSDVKISESAIPSEKDIPYFLSTLDFLANEASVSVVSVHTSPGRISTESGLLASKEEKVDSNQVGKVSLNVVVEGSFESLKAFLTKMSSSLPLQSVNSINFTRRGKSEEIFGTVSATFSLFVNYQLLPKTIGKASDPIDKITDKEEKLILSLSSYIQPNKSNVFMPMGRVDPFFPL